MTNQFDNLEELRSIQIQDDGQPIFMSQEWNDFNKELEKTHQQRMEKLKKILEEKHKSSCHAEEK